MDFDKDTLDYFDHGHYNLDGSPKKCYLCNGKEFVTHIVAIDAYVVSETKIICKCGEIVGYWAYGHYDPCFANTHPTEGP